MEESLITKELIDPFLQIGQYQLPRIRSFGTIQTQEDTWSSCGGNYEGLMSSGMWLSCSLVFTNASEDPAASIFRVED
jgi:hypothetical protein